MSSDQGKERIWHENPLYGESESNHGEPGVPDTLLKDITPQFYIEAEAQYPPAPEIIYFEPYVLRFDRN